MKTNVGSSPNPETGVSQMACEPHIMRCECYNWARTDQSLISEHHKNCPKYNPEEDATKIIRALIKGIEEWAHDEDGVHPSCWGAYQTACHAIGLSHHIKHS